jgi:hypothetical protein
MVKQPQPRFEFKTTEDGGVRRTVIRLACTYDGHTHVYEYPPDEAEDAAQMVALHVHEGQLHPAAGSILCRMIFSGMRDE